MSSSTGLLYEALLQLERGHGAGVLVTVVAMEGSGPSRIGGKMLCLEAGDSLGTVGGGDLELLAQRKAAAMLAGQESPTPHQVTYDLSGHTPAERYQELEMACGGSVTLFYEIVGRSDRLTIFGAGHIGLALLRLGEGLGFFVTMIDERPEQLKLAETASRRLASTNAPVGGHFVVIATYQHDLDFQILTQCLGQDPPPRYVGVVASARKRSLFLSRLAEAGIVEPGILHMPAGLDLGGRTPLEIALSIVAEIQALRHGRTGHAHLGV